MVEGVSFRRYSLPRRPLRCAICGRVHLQKRFLLLVALVALLLATAGWLIRPPAGDPKLKRKGALRANVPVSHRMDETAMSTMPPSRTQPPPRATPTPLTGPTTGVIWNRTGPGTYLWDRPGGRILDQLPNGAVVQLLDSWLALGGVPFGEVDSDAGRGWADMRHVHRIRLPEEGYRVIQGEGWANLYAAPSGAIITWLPPGTPVMRPDDDCAGDWCWVTLLIGGQTGWLRAASIAYP